MLRDIAIQLVGGREQGLVLVVVRHDFMVLIELCFVDDLQEDFVERRARNAVSRYAALALLLIEGAEEARERELLIERETEHSLARSLAQKRGVFHLVQH